MVSINATYIHIHIYTYTVLYAVQVLRDLPLGHREGRRGSQEQESLSITIRGFIIDLCTVKVYQVCHF